MFWTTILKFLKFFYDLSLAVEQYTDWTDEGGWVEYGMDTSFFNMYHPNTSVSFQTHKDVVVKHTSNSTDSTIKKGVTVV